MKTSFILIGTFLVLSVNVLAQEAFQSPKLEINWELKGVESPSCVVFDSKNEVFYVAHKGKISGLGKLTEDGYISVVTKDGTIKNNMWIKDLITPLDMVIFENNLYVADMNHINIISIDEGKTILKVPVNGAMYLNSITADKNGIIYIADMITKKIYVYQSRKATEFMDAGDMGFITAFATDGDRLLCAGKDNIYLLDVASKYGKVTTKKTTDVSGMAIIDEERFLYSVIAGSMFLIAGKKQEMLLNKPGAKFERLIFVKESNSIVLTYPKSNSIVCYTLKP